MGTLDEAPIIQFDSDSLTLRWGVCGAMTYSGGKGVEDDNQK